MATITADSNPSNSHPMRIAMLSYHASPLASLGGKKSGGMNVYVGELARALAARGHQVDVFTRGPRGVQPLASDVRLISLPAGVGAGLPRPELAVYLPEFISGVGAFASGEGLQYDLIHAHYWLSGVVGMHLKRAWDVPLVVMFHTLGLVKNRIAVLGQQESAARIRGERRVLAAADRVVAATPAERADLQWLYELRSDKVCVIPPGVDLARFHPQDKVAARSKLGWQQDVHSLLYVGRIEALKGIDTLIRAMHFVRDQAPELPFRVHIIGGDLEERFDALEGEMARLRALTYALGLQDHIEFLGSRSQEELPAYYAAADTVVMPSYSESFGMVALEAMACGRPVIASNVGGLQYLVQNGLTGFHVREGQAQELAGRVLTLLGDEAAQQRMAAAARTFAETYSWSRAAGKIEALYFELT